MSHFHSRVLTPLPRFMPRLRMRDGGSHHERQRSCYCSLPTFIQQYSTRACCCCSVVVKCMNAHMSLLRLAADKPAHGSAPGFCHPRLTPGMCVRDTREHSGECHSRGVRSGRARERAPIPSTPRHAGKVTPDTRPLTACELHSPCA